jgi:methyl-accepting chemotaxis protein
MFKKANTAQQAELEAIYRAQAVIHFTPQGIVISANDLFLKITGYTLEEIKGRHHSMFCEESHTKSREYEQFWQQLASSPQYLEGEFKRLGKNNQELWLKAFYIPILDDAKNVTSVVKYATDIINQKLIFANYQGQLAAIDKSNAVIEFNLDGTIITANENFLQAIGYTLAEIQNKHHRIFLEEAYASSEDYKEFWQKLARGEYVAGEFKRKNKSGKDIWIQASYNPIMDINQKPFKVVKYASDITAQKLIDADFQGQIEAIRKSQAVIEFTPEGIILDANDLFLQAMGYTLVEIKGKHHRIFAQDSYANSPEYVQFWQDLANGKYFSGVCQRIKKNQTVIWLKAIYNPIFDANGRVYKILKFASNISKVVEIETIADQTALGVHSVAAAVEEMTAAVVEISKNMHNTKESAEIILNDATTSSHSATQLTSSMKTMENVVEIINTIASQVNLLALNATIEAARAGEAGKGFAVVAAEVKNLANQTMKATEDIAQQIQGVQKIGNNVALGIENIFTQVNKVNQNITAIAGAVEEQSVVIKEVSANTQKMSNSVEDIAQRIKEL